MNPIALELSDVGIMAAAKGSGGLIPLDGVHNESPGYALPEKKGLLVGKRAEGAAHLHPRESNNRFWDQLSRETLKPARPVARNHAEMAYFHMASIWARIKGKGDGLVIAVPGFYESPQLGLLLGIARELSIPVEGIVALPLAAASEPCPEKLLLHLDIHLHRLELTFLEQDEQLIQRDTLSVKDKGLYSLQREWVQAIADAFVHATRYDPLHQAATEQELYDRLPEILAILGTRESMTVEMMEGRRSYRITLNRDLLLERAATVIEEIRGMIKEMVQDRGKEGQGVMLQVTHRVARIPGFSARLAEPGDESLVALAPGAGALGALVLWENTPSIGDAGGISFTGRRPWLPGRRAPLRHLKVGRQPGVRERIPTHILCGETAFPISDAPLELEPADPVGESGAAISHAPPGAGYCSIQRKGEVVILENHSPSGTYVDDELVFKTTPLSPGQVLRLGDSREELRLIVCLETHET